ncbi:LysR substrate-binding domain-containing protein [Streptomyces naphthomycinicus]|uniref:LysR substrate-binding domain-containing protein n=1 Tax=Streptomyces naphthomycinicus TaxID=2872625 RepID=UPI001CED3F11|nr:LysR substrate-binding domain-containing protein [Streptomyces sp. TML10]
MFSLDQLAGFVAVAEEGHFGRAAARLNMTQPPLSRRVQALEQQIGVQLLDRSQRGVRLTAAGHSLLADARRILQLSERSVHSARRAMAGETGTITFGFTASSGYVHLETVLATARARLPRVDLVLREMVTSAQCAALLAGDLDVGLVRPPLDSPELSQLPFAREPLVAALPAGHPLATRAAAPDVRDLDGVPFLMYDPDEAWYFHDLLGRLFQRADATPVYVQHASQVHTLLALVGAGLGICLVPEAARRLHADGVVFRPVTGMDDTRAELRLAWCSDHEGPALTALVAALRDRREPAAR